LTVSKKDKTSTAKCFRYLEREKKRVRKDEGKVKFISQYIDINPSTTTKK
jgi:hypothetical protein